MSKDNLVLDINDKSGMGMFSKQGRYITKKFLIFRHRDEILNEGSPNPSYLKFKYRKAKTDAATGSITNLKKANAKYQISSRVIKKNLLKTNASYPPVGNYKPSYICIDKSISTPFIGKKKKNLEDNFFETLLDMNHAADEMSLLELKAVLPEPKAEKPKVVEVADSLNKTSFSIGKQIGREKLKNYQRISRWEDPHEKKFETVRESNFLTNVKRVTGIDFNKMMSRGNTLFKGIDYSPDYAPMDKLCRRRLDLIVPDFSLVQGRDDRMYNDTRDELSPATNLLGMSRPLIYPRVKVSDFKRQLPRREENSLLPLFMEKSITTRLNVSLMNQKSLEMNNFTEREEGKLLHKGKIL